MRTNEHAFGVDDDLLYRLPVPSSVLGVGHISRALLGHSCQAPKANHYSFHIWDAEWGHITIEMSGHPPFGAQIILNGHEYVACAARKAGIEFEKEGNCLGLLSRICGLIPVPGVVPSCDTGPFPWLCRCESRRIVW